MSPRPRTTSGSRPFKLVYLVPILLAVAVGAYLFARTWSGSTTYSIWEAVPVGGDRLLLVEGVSAHSIRDPSAYDIRWRRLAVISPDGAVLEQVDERRRGGGSWQDAWQVYGVTGDVVWLGQPGSKKKRVYARRLADLALVPGIYQALHHNAMLERRYEDYKPLVLGTIPQGVVLLGADERVYVMDAKGTIEQEPKAVKCNATQMCEWTRDGQQIVVKSPLLVGMESSGPLVKTRVDVGGLDLIEPKTAGISFADPTSVLVRSVDVDAPGQTDLLSRATGASIDQGSWQANAVQWTDSAKDLVQPLDLQGKPSAHVIWLQASKGRLRAIVEANAAGGLHTRYQAYLVEIDPATGHRLARHPIGAKTR